MHTFTLSARFSSQSPSEKVLRSSVLLGLSGGLCVGLPLGRGVAALRILAAGCGFLGVRAGCTHRLELGHGSYCETV